MWSIRVQLTDIGCHSATVHALKKASLLSSSGGPLSRPRHVPSSFVASVNKEVRHVIANARRGN